MGVSCENIQAEKSMQKIRKKIAKATQKAQVAKKLCDEAGAILREAQLDITNLGCALLDAQPATCPEGQGVCSAPASEKNTQD